MKRRLRRLAVALAWVLTFVVLWITCLVIHLPGRRGRVVAARGLSAYISSQMAGRLEIGRIDELSLDHVVVHHAVLFDPDGRRVLTGDEVVLVPDVRAAWSGSLRFRDARLRGGYVRLIEGEDGMPTFLAALASAEPALPAAGPGLHALVDHIAVSELTAHGSLLGLGGLRVEGLSASGRLEVLDDIRIRIDEAHGQLVAPYARPFEIVRVVARVRGDPAIGTRLYAEARAPGERVEANLHYALAPGADPDAETPDMRLDLLLHADPIHSSTVEEVGLSFASALGGDFRGHLRLSGPPEALNLSAWLLSEGGPLAVTGSVPSDAPFHVQIRARDLDLAPVIPGAPALVVSATLTLDGGETPEAPTGVQLAVEDFDAFGIAVPAFDLTGRMTDDGLHVDGAHTRSGEGHLEASGRVGFDGTLDMRVRAQLPQVAREPTLRRLMPGARGGLRADVRLTGSVEDLNASGSLRMAPFVWGELRADYLQLSGNLVSLTSRPRGRAQLRAGGVVLAGYPIGDGGGELNGGPVHWHSQAHFTAPERELSFDANFALRDDEVQVEAPSFRIRRADVTYDGRLEGLTYRPGRGLSATSVALWNGEQRVEATGEWRAHGPDAIEAHATAVDVASMRSLLPFATPAATGLLSGALHVSGDLETSPVLSFSGNLARGSVSALRRVTGNLGLEYAAGSLTSHGRIVIGGGGAFDFQGTGMLDDVGLSHFQDALREGLYEASLSGDDLDLQGLAPVLPGALTGVAGHVNLQLQFSGMVDVPSFHGSLTSQDLALVGWTSLGAEANFQYEQGVLDTRIITRDSGGVLAEGELSFLADLASLLAQPELAGELLAIAPWRVSLRIPPRVVAHLPAPLHELVGEALDPLMFSVSATFAGGSLPIHGDLSGNLRWMGDFSGLPCGNMASPRAFFEATFAGGEMQADARLFSTDARVMDLSVHAPVPVDEWLAGTSPPALPPLALEAHATDLGLAELPYVCEHLGGRATFALQATDVLGPAPEAHLSLDSSALTARRFEQISARRRQAGLQEETEPVTLSARADMQHGMLSFDGTGEFRNGGSMRATGTIAAPWAEGEFVPTPSAEGLSLDAVLAGAPLDMFLTFVPGIERVSGTLDGRVAATGSFTEPQLEGQVELSNGGLDVVGMGQRLEQARGDLLFSGDRVLLRDVSVSDGEGRASVSGELQLAGVIPKKASLRLTADDFPVRQEGSILATLNGHAALEVDILPERLEGELLVGNLNVLLSETSTRNTQALTPHHDITVVGERFERADDETPYPIFLTVRAPEPLWVRGQDFSARVTANLGVQYTNPSFRVTGDMDIDRGFFEVFGKRFDVRQGAMGFDGGADLDPQVQLVAVHTLRDQSGDTVTVTASGRLSRPQIDFSTSVDGCSDEGQIIALLVSGSCQLLDHSNSTATSGGAQAAEFLQGLAFGVLTLSLREELGQYFPVIVVESGQRGLGGTRIRAGFDARDLLPEVVRRVVTGAYIEGSVDIAGANPDGSQRQAPDVAFLMELRFPRDIVTTGQITINGAWGLDLTWEP